MNSDSDSDEYIMDEYTAKVLDSIKTYDDYIQANILFLKGDITSTWHHEGPLDIETGEYGLINKLVKTCKDLRIITISGQPPLEEIKHSTYDFERGVMNNKQSHITKQKSVIMGFFETKQLQKIIEKLEIAVEDGHRIAYLFKVIKDETYYTNYQSQDKTITKYANVTRDSKGTIKYNTHKTWEESGYIDIPAIINKIYTSNNFNHVPDKNKQIKKYLYDKGVEFTIYIDEYNTKESVEDILIKYEY